MYTQLRGQYPNMEWKKLICNNQENNKWKFILFLSINGRLSTKDRLDKWGIHTNLVCALCEEAPESYHHLFFTFLVSTSVWKKVLAWKVTQKQLGVEWRISWAITHVKAKSTTTEILRISLASIFYHLWMEKNYRTFQLQKRTYGVLLRMIVQVKYCRASLYPRLTGNILNYNFYSWSVLDVARISFDELYSLSLGLF